MTKSETMLRLADAAEVRSFCDEQRAAGARVGFVPTMGYLHQGHLALIERAKDLTEVVVVSIFVNPTQFGEGEDLERYPRDPDGDARKCQAAGVALLFGPEAEAIYPPGFQTFVEVKNVSQGLCGERRPGHFRGVCTVVSKLFNIVGPCVAVFGEKDYQQLQVIRAMARDLALPVQVESAPTVREADGLAMSSRNAYLDAEQRRAAISLHQALCAVAEKVGARDLAAADALAIARDVIEAAPGAVVDYVELRDAETLEIIDVARHGRSVLLLAVRFGKTRLIDNKRL